MIKMVGLDVRDEHRARVEMDERLIALIGFDHVVFTLATMRVRIVRTHDTTDQKRWIEPDPIDERCEHGRGCGLAMRTRYRERGFAHTERCEHLGAMPDLYARLTRGLQFRIVFSDRCGNDHDIGIDSGDILGPLTNEDADASILQLIGIATFAQIRARYAMTLLLRNMSDTAHAHTTDADEMDLLLVEMTHALPPHPHHIVKD